MSITFAPQVEVLRYRVTDGINHIGSPGLLAPDPCGGAIGTAALSSYDALIVNLGRQHASTVAHNQSTLRADGPLPVIWCGPDDALRDRQRKRNAVLPAFGIVTGGRVSNPTILSRYARICAVEHCCRRSGGLRGNRRCQCKRRSYHPGSGAEARYRVALVSPSRCGKKERRTHDDHLRPRKSALIMSSDDDNVFRRPMPLPEAPGQDSPRPCAVVVSAHASPIDLNRPFCR